MLDDTSKVNFSARFGEAFGNILKSEIAAKLGVSKATVTLYTSGHLPPSEMLLKIAELTGCNLHWLMTGCGPKWARAEETLRGGHVLALYNQSGGTGKSIAAAFIAMSLARRGYRTLLADDVYDGCSVSLFFHELSNLTGPNFTHELDGSKINTLFHTPVPGLDVCLNSVTRRKALMDANIEHLSVAPSELTSKYDFIIMDTMPSTRLYMAVEPFRARLLIAAKLLIPSDEYRIVRAINETFAEIDLVRSQSDEIKLLGAFISMAGPDKLLPTGIVREARHLLGEKWFAPIVHSDTRTIHALISGEKEIYQLSSRVRVVQEYAKLSAEITRRLLND
jgi:cellulose biosynthesis protein BcsQ